MSEPIKIEAISDSAQEVFDLLISKVSSVETGWAILGIVNGRFAAFVAHDCTYEIPPNTVKPV